MKMTAKLARAALAERLILAAGTDVARMIDAQDGWPSRVEVKVGETWRTVELFVAAVGSMSRDIDYEYRFQNAGENRPIQPTAGAIPLLAGYTDDWGRPICVAGDVTKRIGNTTRFSVLFHKSILEQAATSGWGDYVSDVDERIAAFHPRLLPLYIEMHREGLAIPEIAVVASIQDTGVLDRDDEQARERLKRATMRLIRDSRFSANVLRAYEARCAACGFDKGLVEAAHIYPAAAPGSPDEVWNGLALCANHHRLFDSYRLYVKPDDLSITIHPSMLENLTATEEVFIASTYAEIAVPPARADHPRPTMFAKRYEREERSYAWAK